MFSKIASVIPLGEAAAALRILVLTGAANINIPVSSVDLLTSKTWLCSAGSWRPHTHMAGGGAERMRNFFGVLVLKSFRCFSRTIRPYFQISALLLSDFLEVCQNVWLSHMEKKYSKGSSSRLSRSPASHFAMGSFFYRRGDCVISPWTGLNQNVFFHQAQSQNLP